MTTVGRPTSIALADSIMRRFPDPDSIPYRRWCYVQGFDLCGFEKLWTYTRDARYFDYLRTFADHHVTADGELRDFSGDSLDDMMAGTVIVAVYEHSGEARYKLAADRIRRAFDDYPRNADGGFWHGRRLPHEMWIDGVFMGGMFLTRYGSAIGDRDYCFDEAARQIMILAAQCRKGDSGLFLHAYDESRSVSWADQVTGLSCDVWSEGLGWYALILVETLALMPADHADRAPVMGILAELVQGLAKVQDADSGLWYQVVDKGDRADNWHDTSGSAMFVYAIQRAVELGYVERQGTTRLPGAATRACCPSASSGLTALLTSTTPATASASSAAMRTTSTSPSASTPRKPSGRCSGRRRSWRSVFTIDF